MRGKATDDCLFIVEARGEHVDVALLDRSAETAHLLTCATEATQLTDLDAVLDDEFSRILWVHHESPPQAFQDGKRALLGTHVVECPEILTSESCGLVTLRLIPLRWNNTADGTEPRGQMRELRLHPDNVHVGFGWIRPTANGATQNSFIGRMSYGPSPTLGDPLVPRYDLTDVRILYNEESVGG